MTLHEIASYALLKPEIYGWNYYTPFEELQENYSKEKTREQKDNKKQYAAMMDHIYCSAFGTLTWLLFDESINNKQYMSLVHRMEAYAKAGNSLRLVEFYKTADDLLDPGFGNETEEVRNSLMRIMKKMNLSFLESMMMKKALRAADDEKVWHISDVLKEKAVQQFIKTNTDGDNEYRFRSPRYYKEATEKLGQVWGKEATCIIGTPYEAYSYYKHRQDIHKERYEKVVSINAPDVIIKNEKRLYHESFVPYALSALYQKKELNPEDVIDSMNRFTSLLDRSNEKAKDNGIKLDEYVENLRKRVEALDSKDSEEELFLEN